MTDTIWGELRLDEGEQRLCWGETSSCNGANRVCGPQFGTKRAGANWFWGKTTVTPENVHVFPYLLCQ
jgi:hypothetical protein